MIKPSWGTKRTCTCGIRFYDLNKKEIECPSCGETINVEKLSINALENNLRKKAQSEVIEETKPKVKKKKLKESNETEIEVDSEESEKIQVEEIIGDKIKDKIKDKEN